MEHYLDNSATTRVCPEAAAAALRVMTELYGNPSSTHTKGREAKKLLDDSRKKIASALGGTPGEVVFTSCGSESDNWAILKGAELMKRKGDHIISSLVEHDAVRKSLDLLEESGFRVTRLRPDASGAISADQVREALCAETILVTLMMVNNETGAVTDISSVSQAMKEAHSSALLHTDAVQAFTKIPFRAKTLGADLISISGHKIHAPKGIGALWIRSGVRLKPMIVGGGQEEGRRAGTEALPQIAAFAEAAALAADNMEEKVSSVRDLKQYAVETLCGAIPEIVTLKTDAPHILSISMPGWRSEVLMNLLESRGVYVSKSSACKKGGRSHVLEAIGMKNEVIDGALRIGLSRYSTRKDIDALRDGLTLARETLAHR